MPSYYIHTFGCQSNKSDSERIEGDYQARGYTPAKSWKTADEVIINTCAVRQRAEDRAKGFIHNIVTYFEEKGKPRPKLILTGCMTHHGNKHLLEMIPVVDEILPINEVGFNQAAVRREQSRPMDSILSEVHDLVAKGYTEITLLGMNVNSWGLEKIGIGLRKMLIDRNNTPRASDLPTNQSQYKKFRGTPPFVKLLQEISKVDGIGKIRFLSSNPWDFHDELITEIAHNAKIDRYIHLPIQSGSNSVLKRMNRGYTRQDYLNLVQKLRRSIPDVVIGTDIIVGFPGETDQEFQDTVVLAKKIGWKIGFVAIYSPRPGTTAWRLYPDDIPHKIKKQRLDILDQIINKDNLNQRPIV